MIKLSMTVYGCDLYIDGDEAKAKLANGCIESMVESAFGIKPDWYYKAKARHALGIDS